MNAETAAQLGAIVQSLGEYAHVARKSQFTHAALLLEMAKLEMQMALFDISHDELEALRSFVGDAGPAELDAAHLPAKVVSFVNQLTASRKPDCL